MLTGVFVFLTVFVLVLTLLPLSKKPVWWVRGADFPRVQIAAIGVCTGVGAVLCLNPAAPVTQIVVGLNGLCVAYQLWWVIPYTRLFSKEVKAAGGHPGSDRLRILSINVLMTNRRAEELIAIVEAEDPDVLVTLETNQWWEEALRCLEKRFPHRMSCPLENLYGMHLYSRFPLEDGKIQFLVERDVPSMHTLVVLPSGARVCLHCLHPAPPSPTENPTSRERDAELVMVGRSAARARFPVIVSGDLNDVAWSATTRLFRKVSGLCDPRVGRGMFNTYHAGHWYCRWPVDHFFHSGDFTLVRLARLRGCGSDHFPVLIELSYEPGRGARPQVSADGSDEAEADEKMREKDASSVEVHRPGEFKGRPASPVK